MNTAWELLGHRTLSALGNGLYQGLLVALAVGIALQFLRRANAATRHAVALAALVIVAGLPALHFLTAPAGTVRQVAAPAPASGRPAPAPKPLNAEAVPFATLFILDALAVGEPNSAERNERPPEPAVLPAWPEAVPSPAVMGLPSPNGDEATASSGAERVAAAKGAMAKRQPDQKDDPGLAEQVIQFIPWPREAGHWRPAVPAEASLGLLALWLIVAGLRLARLGWQYAALRRLKRESDAPPADVAARFAGLRTEMGLTRAVRLGVSGAITSPVAAGFFRPAVLLPAELLPADGADLDALLRHELAHLHRRDDWTNLLQQLVQAALFFHPGVWWLSRRLTLDREIACDDHVLAANRAPRDYALLLAEFAGRTRDRLGAAAPAAWRNPSQLKERIHMILDANRNASPRPARARVSVVTTAAVLIAATAWLACPRLALAQPAVAANPASEPKPATAPKLKEPPVAALPALPPAAPAAAAVNAAPPAPVAPEAAPLPVLVGPDGIPGGLAVHRPGRGPGRIALAMPNPVPSPHPVPEVHVIAGPPSGDALERRLDRLERMVESLMRRELGPAGLPDAKDRKEKGKDVPPPGLEKPRVNVNDVQLNVNDVQVEVQRALEQVAREVERATRQAEQAAAQGERAAERVRVRLEAAVQQRQQLDGKRVPLDAERQALHAQREQLQRQVEAIQHQMERLEEHLERVDEQLEGVDERIEEIVEEHEEKSSEARSDPTSPPPAQP